MTRLTALLGAVRDSRWVEIRDMAEAQAALLCAQATQWLLPSGKLVEVARTVGHVTPVSLENERLGARLSDAVNRAARYGVFHPKCLARALALSRILDAHGINGHRVRIGVRKVDEQFVAHAWVELANTVLGDASVNTAAYTPLTDVSLNRRGEISSSKLGRVSLRRNRT